MDESKSRSVVVGAGDAALQGDLALPAGAPGVVVFAHGSGSDRHSPRNRFVAEALAGAGLATLLVDLLTPEEKRIDEHSGRIRFDIALLARRLTGVVDWLGEQDDTSDLRIGLYGSSTGAAAALISAAERPERISTVVSRGGRSDLAGDALGRVRTPTLFIVGGHDLTVLELNRASIERMSAPTRLEVIPGAGHLFERPGALEQVSVLARDWFRDHLGASALSAHGA